MSAHKKKAKHESGWSADAGPAQPPAPTKLTGGPQRIIDIIEYLRREDRNKDGYLHGAGLLVKFKKPRPGLEEDFRGSRVCSLSRDGSVIYPAVLESRP